MSDYLKELGTNLRAERQKTTLLPEQLSDRAGLSVHVARQIELAHTDPKMTTLSRLCAVLAAELGQDSRTVLTRVLPAQAAVIPLKTPRPVTAANAGG